MTAKNETKLFSLRTEGDDRFGFTLAGQYPCHLVKIQVDSPAHKAGLKSGDEIIEVNGVNVEDLKHDCVASFIAPADNGVTEIRIRRTTQIPSSPQTVKTSGRSVHRSVSEDLTCNSSKAYLSDVVDRVVDGFKPLSDGERMQWKDTGLTTPAGKDVVKKAHCGVEEVTATAATSSTPEKGAHGKVEVIVGYLGSIHQPVATKTSDFILSHVRTQVIPLSAVLLEVSATTLRVRDANNQVLLTCPTRALQYIGICPENQQILGLFTHSAGGAKADEASVAGQEGEEESGITSHTMVNCSCHLFMIESHLIRHLNHKAVIDQFQLLCTPDTSTGSCQHFPTSSRLFLNSLLAVLRDTLEIRKAELPEFARSLLDGISSDEDRTNSESAHCCDGSDGINDHLIANKERNGGDGHGIVLCLHLHSLLHYTEDKATGIMSYCSQEDYDSKNGEHTGIEQENASEVTVNIDREGKSSLQEQPAVLPQVKDEEGESNKPTRRHHKTLAHRRSQSLAGNVTNLLKPCSIITQSLQVSAQDTRPVIGNGGRPMFHSSSNILTCNAVNNVDGRVAKWALAFDKLLEDKIGLSIFRSFLQKEYSEENLIFWLTCEKYKNLTDKDELKKTAEEIYETHLKSCATLPVNVESSAIRFVEEKLEDAQNDLFISLQYQVYTLMKFDSYARFLKSDLYRQCWVDELEGRPLLSVEDEEVKKPEEGTGTLRRMVKLMRIGDSTCKTYCEIEITSEEQFGSSTKSKGWSKGVTKSQTFNESDENKKKSFLPWRGRVKSEQTKKLTNRSSDSQGSSARSSVSSLSDSVFSANITNSEENLTIDSDSKDQIPPTCRVILPNRSLMYLFCKSTRSLKDGLAKLCEKKEYSLPALDLFIGDNKLTSDDLQKKLTHFVNKEIVLKQGVLFRLEIASEKSFGVKADADKTICEVLGPILRESYLDIDNVTIRRINNQQLLSKDSSVLSLHQHHVVVEKQIAEPGRRASDSVVKRTEKNMRVNNNDIMINITTENDQSVDCKVARCEEDNVFDAIMCGKRQSITGFNFDRNGVFCPEMKQTSSKECLAVKKDDKQRMTRSPALFRKKKREVTQVPTTTFKTFVQDNQKKETEELLTLLRRTQNARLDDQRGMLDKNVELPDFLKLPEKAPLTKRNTLLDVGVLSPRHQHQALKKTTSSPPTAGSSHNVPQRSQSTRVAVDRPVPPERSASVARNWTGSLRIRGRTHVESVTRVVTETQTIDRRHFTKGASRVAPKHRGRSESLQHDRSEDFLVSTATQDTRQTTATKTNDDVIWVSSPTSSNRRRAHSQDQQSKTDEVALKDTPTPVEVIVPDTNGSASRFPITGSVIPCMERSKPITDSTYFKEFLETQNLKMPSDRGESVKAHDFDVTNDREAILDNSFLREQLKPSRLFSQLTPEARVATPTPSSTKRQDDVKKCPLFIPVPPALKVNAFEDDSGQKQSKARKNRIAPSEDETGESGNKDEESVRVTFV